MRTILCLAALVTLSGCADSWHQLPHNPDYKYPPETAAKEKAE